MSDDLTPSDGVPERPAEEGGRVLSPAARRALAEADARRAAQDAKAAELGTSPEQGGRGGLDPVRFDDWEIGGRAVDF